MTEARQWIERGHAVQLLCEGSPWPEDLNDDPRAAPFKRRSFAVVSGSMPARVSVMLVANVVGDCPNLKAGNVCGIYADRPLVCRIYPAEVNPSIALEAANKACPPEAWTLDLPLMQRRGTWVDATLRGQIESARTADGTEAEAKARVCASLSISATALVHEAVLAYSPAPATLLAALASAVPGSGGSTNCEPPPETQWKFVSNQSQTIKHLATQEAHAVHLDDSAPDSFELLGFRRKPIFGGPTYR